MWILSSIDASDYLIFMFVRSARQDKVIEPALILTSSKKPSANYSIIDSRRALAAYSD
jgi:hypothetical protein